MASPGHDFRVVILLTAEEYLGGKGISEELGLSQSAYIRSLIKKDIRDRALRLVSAEQADLQMSEPAQVVTNHSPVIG